MTGLLFLYSGSLGSSARGIKFWGFFAKMLLGRFVFKNSYAFLAVPFSGKLYQSILQPLKKSS